ncbi:unnamed protein product [Pipistrellus nathusii]|uniref:Uncharacterized protein n=1 Tax=Pipistrellus nathusii TaxID=59473 RepID=A0ABN9ZTI7_PIPNA
MKFRDHPVRLYREPLSSIPWAQLPVILHRFDPSTPSLPKRKRTPLMAAVRAPGCQSSLWQQKGVCEWLQLCQAGPGAQEQLVGRSLGSDQQHWQLCVLTAGQVQAAQLPSFQWPVRTPCPHVHTRFLSVQTHSKLS